MASKYIRLPDNKIVLFPVSMEHKQVADALGVTPKSAGFFMTDDETSLAYGDSLTLGIGPLPDDKALILRAIGVEG